MRLLLCCHLTNTKLIMRRWILFDCLLHYLHFIVLFLLIFVPKVGKFYI